MQLEILHAPYLEDPCQWLEIFKGLPNLALLDSCHFGGDSGRYHIITGAPQQWLTLQDGELYYRTASDATTTKAASAEQCWQAIASLQSVADIEIDLPFCGGLLGFLGYEFGVWSELGIKPSNEINFPDFAVGNFRWALVQDNLNRSSTLVMLADCEPSLRQRLLKSITVSFNVEDYKPIKNNRLANEVNFKSYAKAVERIKHYILAGDCYQVNYTQRFANNHVDHSSLTLYRQLRQSQPGPMAAYLQISEDQALLSLSPERLVKSNQGRVLAQPIKGTIKRSKDPEKDRALASQLVNSEKDKAENLMIVDLLRNDLGRVCDPGSIHVPKLFALESFENVHHLISSIEGKLNKAIDNLGLLRACFPGGSITGAPKRRAMEIIQEIEAFGRNAYCGSLFYSSVNRRFDSNITIRTLVASGKELYCWGGGGITAGSNIEDEYQESITKVATLIGR